MKFSVLWRYALLSVLWFVWSNVGADDSTATFEKHGDSVYAVAFSPDNEWAISASADETLELWDVGLSKNIRTFNGSLGETFFSVAFSPSGTKALSGSAANTLKLWDVANAAELLSFSGHSDWIYSVAFSPDGTKALSGSADKILKLWNINDGTEIRSFEEHSDVVNTVAFSPDGTKALSGSRDKTLILWDIASGNVLRKFIGHDASVNTVAFSPSGGLALSGSAKSGSTNNTLIFWNVNNGSQVHTLIGHGDDDVRAVAFSPDGLWALSGSTDKTIKMWDVTDGTEISSEYFNGVGHESAVNSVAFSPNGTLALSGSKDNKLKLWNVPIFPVANFTYPSTTGPIPVNVVFDASTSTISHGSIASYHWVINNQELTGEKANYEFNSYGTFPVSLYVTSVEGINSKVTEQEIEIKEEQTFILTLNSSGQGSATATPTKSEYDLNEVVELKAVPTDDCYVFAGWKGDNDSECGDSSTCKLLMDSNKSLQATFAKKQYKLNVYSANGTVRPSQRTYECGSEVTLFATSNDNCYEFENWAGEHGNECSSRSEPAECKLTVNNDKFLEANFSKKKYTLTIDSPNGTVLPEKREYLCGDQVALVAIPDNGYVFDGWQGDVRSSSSGVVINVDSNKEITAEFTLDNATLHIVVKGEGTVTTTSRRGINCSDLGGDCKEKYEVGDIIDLTQEAALNFTFVGWEGDCSSNTVTISKQDMVCIAEFALVDIPPPPTQILHIVKTGTGSGQVLATEIDCGDTCKAEYKVGDEVRLTPVSDSDSVFVAWEGYADCLEDGIVTMPTREDVQDVVCIARFETKESVQPERPTLHIFTAGTGQGSVTAKGGISCHSNGGNCSAEYDLSTQISLVAEGIDDSIFTGWKGHEDCSNGEITLYADMSCIAEFAPAPRPTLHVFVAGNGKVTTTDGIDCSHSGGICRQEYTFDTEVTLVTADADDSTFQTWKGDPDCNNGVVTLRQDLSCIAEFVPLEKATLQIVTIGNGQGKVTTSTGMNCNQNCSEEYPLNQAISLSVETIGDSVFVDWQGDEDCDDGVLELSEDMVCIAEFVPIQQHTLQIFTMGQGTVTTPKGTKCSNRCTELYSAGEVVMLTAEGGSDSSFNRWLGDDDCENGEITLSRDVVCIAEFLPIQKPTLQVFITGGEGRVTAPSDLDCHSTGGTCSQAYDVGETVVLTPENIGNATFKEWGGDEGCSNGEITLFSDASCIAKFEPLVPPPETTLQIFTTGAGQGKVIVTDIDCVSDCTQEYLSGQNATLLYSDPTKKISLSAESVDGSTFKGWKGDSVCRNTEIIMATNVVCIAEFVTNEPKKLQILTAGSGQGKVITTNTSTGIDCGVDCTETYPLGTTVSLTTESIGDSTFIGWKGDGSCKNEEAVINIIMSDDMVCVAEFAPKEPQSLQIFITGTGQGKVTTTNIDCGVNCSAEYDAGEVITLMPEAIGDSRFVGWQGDKRCGNNDIIMSLDMVCVAEFALIQTHTLQVLISDTELGSVTTSAGINCSDSCTETHLVGEKVTLTPTPADKANFIMWKGDEDCQDGKVTLSQNLVCIAEFASEPPPIFKTLQIFITGLGKGTVTTSTGIECSDNSDDCIATYEIGTDSIILTPNVSGDSTFTGWLGDDDCQDNKLKLSKDIVCIAEFSINESSQPRTLQIYTTGTGSGKVTGDGIDCGRDCTATYTDSPIITLTAESDSDSVFAGWKGDDRCLANSSVTEVPLFKDMVCIAEFVSTVKPILQVFTIGVGQGTITITEEDCTSGDCIKEYKTGENAILPYDIKQKITLNAQSSDDNSNFIGWKGDTGCVNGTITLSQSMTCIAEFEIQERPEKTLYVIVDGNGKITAEGINCGRGASDCSQNYSVSSVVELKSKIIGESILNWKGDDDCADGEVILSKNVVCIAEFEPAQKHKLQIFIIGTGKGKVTITTSADATKNCTKDTDCTEEYRVNENIILAAEGISGARFVEWKGDGDCLDGEFVLSEDTVCLAEFVANQPPVPVITIKPKVVQVNETIKLDAGESYDPDGQSLTSYEWAINGEQIASGRVVEHSFSQTGLFTVKLTVKDAAGAVAEEESSVNVQNNRVDVIAIAKITPNSGKAPLTVQFDGSRSRGDISTYEWSTSTGQQASGSSPSLTFNEAGTHTVTLKVSDGHSEHSVTNTVVVYKNQPPVPIFKVTPDSGVVSGFKQLTVNADAEESYDPDGDDNQVIYQWFSSDGKTDNGKTASFTYRDAGDYKITLRVTDEEGDSAETSKSIEVKDNKPPIANATVSRNSINAVTRQTTVTLDASKSRDPENAPLIYDWQSSDGQTDTGLTGTMTFTPGTHVINLTVTDEHKERDIASNSVVVTPDGQVSAIEINAKVTADKGCAPVKVTVDASRSYSPDGTKLNYAWSSAKEGHYSSKAKDVFTFFIPQTHQIRLGISDNNLEHAETYEIEVGGYCITPCTKEDCSKASCQDMGGNFVDSYNLDRCVLTQATKESCEYLNGTFLDTNDSPRCVIALGTSTVCTVGDCSKGFCSILGGIFEEFQCVIPDKTFCDSQDLFFSNGSCIVVDKEACEKADGTFSASLNQCEKQEIICEDGNCSEDACERLGGVFDDFQCTLADGALCDSKGLAFVNDRCIVVDKTACEDAGLTFLKPINDDENHVHRWDACISIPELGMNAVNKVGDFPNLSTTLFGGFSLSAERDYIRSGDITFGSFISIAGRINVDPIHVGREAELVVFAGNRAPQITRTKPTIWYHLLDTRRDDNNADFEFWVDKKFDSNGKDDVFTVEDLSTLATYRAVDALGSVITLDEKLPLHLWSGGVVDGTLKIYFGYRLIDGDDDGSIFINADPIFITINNPANPFNADF